MNGKNVSVPNEGSDVPDSIPPMSMVSPQNILQRPEPTAQRYPQRDHSGIPSPQPSTGSRPRSGINGNYDTRLFADTATRSARSSRSSNGQQRSNTRSQPTNRRLTPLETTMPGSGRASPRDGYMDSPHRSLHDPEDATRAQYPGHSRPNRGNAFSTYVSEEEEDIKEHTVWILVSRHYTSCYESYGVGSNRLDPQVYLSFFSPVVATCISAYALLTTFLLLLLSPFLYFCKSCRPLRHRFRAFLAPPIHFQLGVVFSDEPEPIGSDEIKEETYDTTPKSNVLMLIVIHIFSPAYAVGIAALAWVAAGFWATALVLGNPDGRDGRDDGKAVVLGVRRLWERWLRRGLR
ncbi:MAG: hypothetical protein Q9219_001328 [cf. Caloplaca sp. 3 TL-2023]